MSTGTRFGFADQWLLRADGHGRRLAAQILGWSTLIAFPSNSGFVAVAACKHGGSGDAHELYTVVCELYKAREGLSSVLPYSLLLRYERHHLFESNGSCR